MRNYLKLIAMSSALAVVAAPIAAEARPAKRVVKVCRKSSGTAGLIAGGAGGALLGHAALGGPVGMVAGAVGGARVAPLTARSRPRSAAAMSRRVANHEPDPAADPAAGSWPDQGRQSLPTRSISAPSSANFSSNRS
jgi:hypothetical protein